MRILHTADWHLGRIFYAHHLTDDQAYVLEHQFFQIIKEEKIDVVIIAGDVFDRSVPPVEAVQLWDLVITKLAVEYRVPTIVIAGNHDGVERLEVGRHVLASMGLHIVGSPEEKGKPIVISDAWGDISFCPMPYVEPAVIRDVLSRENSAACTMDYNELYALWIQNYLQAIPASQRRVAIAHAFVTGGVLGGSERTLAVGGTENINNHLFDAYQYTALGHLHGPQTVGSHRIRYSGSLLKYSFDEYQQEKSFSIIDMDENGEVTVSLIPIEPKHDVVVVEGYLDAILQDRTLHAQHENDYVLVQLLNEAPVIDGMARLRNVLPHVMAMELTGRMAKDEAVDTDTIYGKLDERQLFAQFAETVWKEPLTREQETYINQIWDLIVKEERS